MKQILIGRIGKVLFSNASGFAIFKLVLPYRNTVVCKTQNMPANIRVSSDYKVVGQYADLQPYGKTLLVEKIERLGNVTLTKSPIKERVRD